MRWRRWIVWILVLGAGRRCWPMPSGRSRSLSTWRLRRGPLEVSIEEEGKTRVTDRFVIHAPVTGFARRIDRKVGDPVRQGEVLARIEPVRAQSLDPRSRAEAQARAASAEADVAYWKSEMARVQQLMKTGDIARSVYDRTVNEEERAEATLLAARYAVGQAEAELEAARALLRVGVTANPADPKDVADVKAPASGRVLKVIHESEGVVTAGEALVELGNARSLEVVVEVLSADAVKISPGTRVTLERWGGEVPLEGRVRRVEPVAFTKLSALGVEEQRVLAVVDIASPPELWQRLGDQYRVEARFILWEAQDILQIPASALFRYEDGCAVFAMENGVARRRKVQTGHRSGSTAEVLNGLQAGEQVIPHPDDQLKDGMLVKPASGVS